ncbi:MAG: glycosyltransferase family 2 protein [Woeseiaceae bacterium]|nr:glycosyltransferase family 2 protein [Woeseiaceae bacterium]
MLELVLWVSLALMTWTYIGYPAMLYLVVLVRRRRVNAEDIEPSCTLIITAYNEEKSIAQKLLNSLSLDYPRDKLQILVASDRSDDSTNEIVSTFADQGVELLVLSQRGGKTAAQNQAADRARGDIVVFTDASTEFTSESFRALLRPFADAAVGCVAAELEYVSDQETGIGKGAGFYWRYERWLKHLESSANSLIGVSGCLYAVRKENYPRISPELISDFVIASEIYRMGLVTVYGLGATAVEKTLEDSRSEFNMRVRVAVRSINALVKYAYMLNPTKYRLFAVQLLSHKVLRYLVPELLLVALISSWLLVLEHSIWSIYGVLLTGQVLGYLLAAVGWVTQTLGKRIPFVYIPFYFLHVNFAALWAQWLYLRGERKAIWTPIR